MKVVGSYINIELTKQNYKVHFELTLDLGFFVERKYIGGKIVFLDHPSEDTLKIPDHNIYKISICFNNRKYLTPIGIYKSLEQIMRGERAGGYYIVSSNKENAEDQKIFSGYHEIELDRDRIISIIKSNLQK